MSKITVVHHTPFNFPLDEHFLGESIVIGSLARNDSLDNHVVSASTNEVHTQGFAGSNPASFLSSALFNAKLVTHPYRSEVDDSYFDFVAELIAGSEHPVVLNYHFLRQDLDAATRTKERFGDKVAAVVHLHCMPELCGTDYYNNSSDKRNIGEILESANVDRFIAVSNAVRTAFSYSGLIPETDIDVVQNGIDGRLYRIPEPSDRQRLREEIGITSQDIIGYVGRMTENKGIHTFYALLDALEKDEERLKDYGIVFGLSDGCDRAKFVARAMEIAPELIRQGRLKVVLDVSKLLNGSGIADDMVVSHFRTQLAQEGIANTDVYGGVVSQPIQSIFNYYVHPAHSEALGLSALESLYMGVPVIASNTGGLSDIVKRGSGVLIEVQKPKSPDDLETHNYNKDQIIEGVQAVNSNIRARLIESPEQIRSQIISQDYTREQMLEKTVACYQRVIDEVRLHQQ